MTEPEKPAKRTLRLSVDWGQKWPLNDYIGPGPIVDWDSKITPELKKRMRDWATFFWENADLDTSLFGSEQKRRWFQVEGFRLLKELQQQAGDEFDFTIDLWF
ncbi:hypothetical protein C5D98_07005 [Rathayibacter rathayi]|uniref:hypothetical protein n=1 Tax=Rathayibacter rathayi TaxID=33887 RepID=UPI000CE84934|nr:hypothetical protein [Rathayibacter rathayi]PPI70495.1 hypothetical protein C5D98_07005 [Rathayibacter rathayi]